MSLPRGLLPHLQKIAAASAAVAAASLARGRRGAGRGLEGKGSWAERFVGGNAAGKPSPWFSFFLSPNGDTHTHDSPAESSCLIFFVAIG